MNEYTTEQVNLRKLQLSEDKCAQMHIKSKNQKENKCESLTIDLWREEKVKVGDKSVLEDKHKGKIAIKKVTEYKYLGASILPDGSNKSTIADRATKGKGFSRDIVHVLEGTFFGQHYFEAFKLLRDTMVYSVLTYNLEVAYNLTKSDLKILDKIDLHLIGQVLMTSSKVSRCLVLLELGLMPVEYVIKQKRLNYLFNLVQMDESSIAKKVFLQQTKSPLKGDFVKYAQEDMKELDLKFAFEEISNISKLKWKKLVKEACKAACLKTLQEDKSKLSKGKEITYTNLEMQAYLKSGNEVTTDLKRKILQVRLRDVALKGNFPKAYSSIECQMKDCKENETQRHVYYLDCTKTTSIQQHNNSIEYEDVFSDNISSQMHITRVIFANITKLKQILPSHVRSEGPEEPRRGGGTRSAATSLVIRKARSKHKFIKTK